MKINDVSVKRNERTLTDHLVDFSKFEIEILRLKLTHLFDEPPERYLKKIFFNLLEKILNLILNRIYDAR